MKKVRHFQNGQVIGDSTILQEVEPLPRSRRRLLVRCNPCGGERVVFMGMLGRLCPSCASTIRTAATWRDPVIRAKRVAGVSRAMKGRVISEDQRGRISETVKLRWAEGVFDNAVRPPLSAERLEQLRRQGRASRGKRRSPETGDKIRRALLGRTRTPAQRAANSAAITAKWRDPVYRAKVLEARATAPNKLEVTVAAELAPLGFRFTGDGTMWVHDTTGSHNPDFKLTGAPVLVELWGDYWHRGEDPAALVAWYRAHGYRCLVIWESELTTISAADRVRAWLEAA